MGRTKGASISSIATTNTDEDPFLRALAPPPDESPDARAARQRAEAVAKKRSDEIDASLAAEAAARRKRSQPIKVLLLGQSESGKSTTLKNFQLTYARKQWLAEKEAWKAVIQLNLVRSVNAIASAVARELDPSSLYPHLHSSSDLLDPISEHDPAETASILSDHEHDEHEEHKFELTDEHKSLIARLSPLRVVQKNLEVKLGSGAEELGYEDQTQTQNTTVDLNDPALAAKPAPSSDRDNRFRDITNNNDPSTVPSSHSNAPSAPLRPRKSQEFFVRSHGWKSALQRLRPRGGSRTSKEGPATPVEEGDFTSSAIARAAGDMKLLWEDKVVKEVIRVRKVKLMDCAEFFLSDIPRVASLRYTPTDDDIVRARLRTVGVQEHALTLEAGPEPGRNWLIYDVGGSRTQRAQWPAYFDDVHAIIFLAPISAFNERLSEDPRVNRLDDSMQLWKVVCSSRLLARTELVLFLNKCDLLERKLRDGVLFGRFVKSYREGENEVAPVRKFLKAKFMEVCRHYSKEHRGLHVHFTSVIDTQATAKTLGAVQDGILRSNLRHLDLI